MFLVKKSFLIHYCIYCMVWAFNVYSLPGYAIIFNKDTVNCQAYCSKFRHVHVTTMKSVIISYFSAKLLAASGLELRRALFSLKQIFVVRKELIYHIIHCKNHSLQFIADMFKVAVWSIFLYALFLPHDIHCRFFFV